LRVERKKGEWLKENVTQGQRSDLSTDMISLKDIGRCNFNLDRLKVKSVDRLDTYSNINVISVGNPQLSTVSTIELKDIGIQFS